MCPIRPHSFENVYNFTVNYNICIIEICLLNTKTIPGWIYSIMPSCTFGNKTVKRGSVSDSENGYVGPNEIKMESIKKSFCVNLRN